MRLRADHRADVAAVEHRALFARGEAALQFDERRANVGDRPDDGGRFAHVARAQARVVEIGERKPPRSGGRGRRVVERQAFVEERAGGGAIEQAGVEMRQLVMRGEPASQRALAGGRRVRRCAMTKLRRQIALRVRVIDLQKLGKLVAIILSSSRSRRFLQPTP